MVLIAMLLLGAFGCSTSKQSGQTARLDRSSPSATFAVYQQGIEKKKFLQAVQSSSHQQKRFMLFETLFAGGMAPDPKKNAFDKLLLANGVELEKLESDVRNADELVAVVERKIDELDQFLADAQTILASDNKPSILPDIKNVTIDGERATLTFSVSIYSYQKNAGDSETKEVVSVHEQNIFMRRHDGDWLICPEGEWKDATFKWTVPD